MGGYQVLARRWRPQRFDDLVGQEVVVRSLRNALTSGQIAHAYLFSGLRGVGKTTVARLLAKALNCETGPTPDPCGRCAACQEIATGSALDVIEMDAASNRGIDDVRELREVARVLPVRDRYRVFILDEAHQLSRDAFNALLKILEEPPAHVVFVLASTEKDKFPATILSRCQQIDFRPIPADLIAERLADIAEADRLSVSSGAVQLIARAADGSLRDALSLLDRVRAFADAVTEDAVTDVLGLPPQEMLLTLWETLAAGDAAGALALLRDQERLGRDAVALYEELVALLETLVLLACDPSARVPYSDAHRARLIASAGEVGLPLLLRLVGLALEQRSLVAGAERPAPAVAVAVGRLALWPRLQRVEALLAGETPASTPPAPSSPRPKASGGGDAGGSHPPAVGSRPRSAGKAQSESLCDRLGDALDEAGRHLLAGRLRAAKEVALDGDGLVIRFSGAPAGTVRSIADGVEEITEVASRLGLPGAIRVEADGQEAASESDALRARVESDAGVKRVLEIFGGKIDAVEETT
ncbi:MAG: DNA polymerase III subunit gamma/tau [Acidobacteriota bacterium]